MTSEQHRVGNQAISAAPLDNYRFLARYKCWFNQRLYEACEKLSDEERQRDRGAFFHSIHLTLTHLVLADKLWLQRFVRQTDAFASLTPALLYMPEGADYTSDLHPTGPTCAARARHWMPRSKPGWQTCQPTSRSRICVTAKKRRAARAPGLAGAQPLIQPPYAPSGPGHDAVGPGRCGDRRDRSDCAGLIESGIAGAIILIAACAGSVWAKGQNGLKK